MEIAIVSLTVIILLLVAERFLYAKEMNRQLGDSIKAIMSRNINEYLAAKSVDKVTTEIKSETDEVLMSDMSDDEYDETIKKMNE